MNAQLDRSAGGAIEETFERVTAAVTGAMHATVGTNLTGRGMDAAVRWAVRVRLSRYLVGSHPAPSLESASLSAILAYEILEPFAEMLEPGAYTYLAAVVPDAIEAALKHSAFLA